ncbi:hypothetical protein [Streptomyces minutiscleroticus]|uniref:hypothetical protein n=1 Tax=Streptomyces minutiscleroticus TaxID=68238 RepID=UPI00331BC561
MVDDTKNLVDDILDRGRDVERNTRDTLGRNLRYTEDKDAHRSRTTHFDDDIAALHTKLDLLIAALRHHQAEDTSAEGLEAGRQQPISEETRQLRSAVAELHAKLDRIAAALRHQEDSTSQKEHHTSRD